MGAWMAGNEPEFQLPFEETWHEQVRASVKQKFGSQPGIADYMRSPRPASPARHAAISSVLNDFSTHVARHVIEEIFKGKLLYAGGDDVLAMVSVDDLLPAMLLLRAAYSGVGDVAGLPDYIDLKGLRIGKGYVWLNGRPMLMMGSRATASMGAVVAHHQAPLGAVLRHLREAEKRAKAHKGADGRDRNAFCLRIMKRGGGEVGITARFWDTADAPTRVASPAGYLLRLADALANTDFSRRAVYKAQAWLADMPPRPPADDAAWREMVASYLAFQFEKQRGFRSLAYEAVALACSDVAPAIPVPDDRIEHREAIALEHLLVVAEFFAREGRVFGKGV